MLFLKKKACWVTAQHPLLKTLNRKASKYESGFDSQLSLFRRAMKAAS